MVIPLLDLYKLTGFYGMSMTKFGALLEFLVLIPPSFHNVIFRFYVSKINVGFRMTVMACLGPQTELHRWVT